jgi:SP family general alpha glucoside:H+ symporter-like MFS transporter
MKGRSYRELDVLFERRISARKFKETVVGQDEGEAHHNDPEERTRRASQAAVVHAHAAHGEKF